jgi:hypothetical protein
MDDSLYDEFGNYLGPELPSSDEEEDNGITTSGIRMDTDYEMADVEAEEIEVEERSTSALVRMEGNN